MASLPEAAMTPTLTLALGSVPLSAYYLRSGPDGAGLLLLAYTCFAGAVLAWLTLPCIDWAPDACLLIGP